MKPEAHREKMENTEKKYKKYETVWKENMHISGFLECG